MDIGDVLSGTAGLAGVQWALLGPEPRAALERTLGALLEDAGRLAGCDLHRAKYKPGRKLTAYYDVRLLGDDAAQQPARPIAVTWEPSLRGPALTDDAAELQDQALRRGLAHPFRRLAADEPAWHMRVQVSPLDAAFPQLVRLSDPGHVRDLLAAAGAASPRETIPLAARCAVVPIRYRPGQRHVLRYDALDADGRASGAVFAKLYRDDAGARAFRVATLVADWLAELDRGMSAVRPLVYRAEDGVILYPQVFGTPLSHVLARPDPAQDQHLRTIGSALQALHRTPTDLAGELKLNDFAAEVKAIARAAEHVHALLPQAAAQIDALLDRARELHERTPQEPPTFAHGDLKADHVWITPGGLTLIDFDTCYLADPAIDVGKFLADLQWWFAAYDRPGVDAAQDQFLAAYSSGAAPHERLARARLYEALVLLKMTVRRVRLFDPDWAPRTERLIARAAALLAAVSREIV